MEPLPQFLRTSFAPTIIHAICSPFNALGSASHSAQSEATEIAGFPEGDQEEQDLEASGSQKVTPWDVQGAIVDGKQVR